MPSAAPRPILYPLFLSLEGRRCLVAGLGDVGRRKLAGLLACGPASVLVLDTRRAEQLSDEAVALLADPRVLFECRSCAPADVRDRTLVFAATGNAGENARIAALCREAGILCNCASAPDLGAFSVPAVARRDGLAAALSTGGASPALARRWRHELEHWLAPRARMVRLMGRLRPLVLALHAETGQNTRLFRALAASPLQNWLAEGDLESCRRWLLAELPPVLHVHIAELLDDLA
ncbi:bifunctional precorrin-2 dehydrogenase/sirohydrochlorin ferrochelatase [uncultured Desulfovibrio sp.]|uniref:precorrin-2 dehydrogenase/sirohydrochlorin ferrochelatase family protein n=1 Tax=uncultured Desulfovibrio sp. TaxID=167968 RepID=UPI0026176381|nr:bifunctional precorrin-2 dehydrogenase/sirohydrochlorin ferrochelatase [uncultured Desulfovibrio sp.]